MNDSLIAAWRALVRRPARSFATIAGFGLAAALMAIALPFSDAAQRAEANLLTAMGTHFVAYVPIPALGVGTIAIDPTAARPLDSSGEPFVVGDAPTILLPADLLTRIRALPDVKTAAWFVGFRFRTGGMDGYVTIGGIDTDQHDALSIAVAPAHVIAGTFFPPNASNAVLIDEGFAVARELRPGDRLVVASRTFDVAGIVRTGVRPAKADVYAPLELVRPLVATRLDRTFSDRANAVLVESRSAGVQQRAVDAVKEMLPDAVVDAFGCANPSVCVLGMNGQSVRLFVLFVVAGCALWAARSQWASVVERRREIGIIRSLGWTRRNVALQLFAESLTQAILGAVLGLLAGWVVCDLVPYTAVTSAFGTAQPQLEMQLALGVVAATLAGGLIAAIPSVASAVASSPTALMRSL